jgi:hypothetical protein
MGRARVVATVLGLVFAAHHPAVVAKEPKAVIELRAAYSRPIEELLPLVTVKGDTLDAAATITTEGVTIVKSGGWLMSFKNEPSFLRGFIDKSTGAMSAQVYHRAVYSGSGWYFLRRASFVGEGGLQTVDALRLGSNVDCSRYGCTYFEDVAFPVPLETLEQISATYSPQNPLVALKYRLFGQSGNTIDAEIPINEIAAFTRKLQDVRASLGLAAAPVAVAPTEPAVIPSPQPAIPRPQAAPAKSPAKAPAKRPSVVCDTCRPSG